MTTLRSGPSQAHQDAQSSLGEGGVRFVARALHTLSSGNRTLLRAANEEELLEAMCRVIVEEGGYRIAGVQFAVDDEPKTLQLVALAFPTDADPEVEQVFRNMFFSWGDNKFGQHPGGVAIRSGQPCIGRDILTDPAMPAEHTETRRFGYASISAFPLCIDGRVVGALSMGAAEPDAFDAQEVALLGELAEDLAYGIANLRTRAKHREAEATIRRMAFYDALTGLPNRDLLRDRLRAALDVAHREHQPLALLVLGLFHLHEINDTLGYASGDQVLQEIGRRLAGEMNEDERAVARVGEGDFAMLLPGADADHARQSGERLARLLQESVEVAGLRLDASAAIGIALYPGHGADPDILLRRARVAMAEARRSGQTLMLYSARLDEAYSGRIALLADLRHAIEHNGLELYCQPKVQVASRRLCGAEALVRWSHPTLGMIPPAEFVTLAEYSGLITPLTQWVLEAAFRHRHAWHDAGLELQLAVNLSAHDLLDPQLLKRIEDLVETWGATPDWIQFELTESAFMRDPERALKTLSGLKALGASLAVDDFGIGHSSLSYLQRLPVDSIKIDQSFVAPLLQRRSSTAIVHSVVALGHDLGLEVVAEGVESQAVWDRITELGCDVIQGYFIGKPMPVEEFQAWQRRAPWCSPGPPAPTRT